MAPPWRGRPGCSSEDCKCLSCSEPRQSPVKAPPARPVSATPRPTPPGVASQGAHPTPLSGAEVHRAGASAGRAQHWEGKRAGSTAITANHRYNAVHRRQPQTARRVAHGQSGHFKETYPERGRKSGFILSLTFL